MDEGHHTPQSPNGEGKIGHVLERTRKDRGLTLEEAEQATKIRKRYLAGLEQDDYTVLPDAVYAQGFLKAYANFLGLDGAELSQELRTRRKPRRERGINYEAPQSDFEPPIFSPGGVSGMEKRGIPISTIVTLLVSLVILAAVIGALYFVGRGVLTSSEDGTPDGQAGGPARQEEQELAARDEKPRPSEDGRDAPASGGGGEQREPVGNEAPLDVLRVGIDVEGSPSWILIRSDGETVVEEVAPPGFSRTIEARSRVSIRTGNAGAVSVEVNGQDVGLLGEPGQVLTRSFNLKSAG